MVTRPAVKRPLQIWLAWAVSKPMPRKTVKRVLDEQAGPSRASRDDGVHGRKAAAINSSADALSTPVEQRLEYAGTQRERAPGKRAMMTNRRSQVRW